MLNFLKSILGITINETEKKFLGIHSLGYSIAIDVEEYKDVKNIGFGSYWDRVRECRHTKLYDLLLKRYDVRISNSDNRLESDRYYIVFIVHGIEYFICKDNVLVSVNGIKVSSDDLDESIICEHEIILREFKNDLQRIIRKLKKYNKFIIALNIKKSQNGSL